MNIKINTFLVGFLAICLILWACRFQDSEKVKQSNNSTKRQSSATPVVNIVKLDTTYNVLAKLLAGVDLGQGGYEKLSQNPAFKKHQSEFAKGWSNLEISRLQKMRNWHQRELAHWDTATYNLFYPFSGPDFLNAYELFPNADNYLLFGLEKIGALPTLKDMKSPYLDTYLLNIRQALSEIFQRNYFITSRMSGAFNTQVKGVLPILVVFLAKTNNEIINIQKIYLSKDGKMQDVALNDNSKNLLSGLHIIFKNPRREVTQHLYYFGTDLSDNAIPSKAELLTWIKDFENKATLIKSASYLLHTANFTTIRNLVLSESKAVLEDDTGVPYRYFKPENWDIQLYGKYAAPIRDFNYGFQSDLDQRFKTDTSVKPIDFTFGYHWWTDKSSILYFKRKNK
jgi:hypothetical protein